MRTTVENDFFVNPSSISSKNYFDEGPKITISIIPLNSSSISTIEVDPYRQGIELTHIKYFDAGTLKIHSGDPGHAWKNLSFGMSNNFKLGDEIKFTDQHKFDPAHYLMNDLKEKIIIGDNQNLESKPYNGVIEPLLIREIASFYSIEGPFHSRTVKASLMDGNQDKFLSNDRIVCEQEMLLNEKLTPFLDMTEMLGSSPTTNYFIFNRQNHQPFIDERLIRNTKSLVEDTSIISAMSNMTGSTDNGQSFYKKISSTGFIFDNMANSTDSIAFGGQLY